MDTIKNIQNVLQQQFFVDTPENPVIIQKAESIITIGQHKAEAVIEEERQEEATHTKSIFIKQPNRITMANYAYNLYEKRLFYYILYKIQNKMVHELQTLERSLFGDIMISLKYTDIFKDLDISGKNHALIKETLDRLGEKSISIENEFIWKKYHLIERVTIVPYAKFITFIIANDIKLLLLDLSKGYTNFNYLTVSQFKSTYTMRIYELCSRWKDTRYCTISFKELKELLQIPDDLYCDYSNFKKRVLEIARKEMYNLFKENKCEIWFYYSEKKQTKKIGETRGRKSIDSIEFYISTDANELKLLTDKQAQKQEKDKQTLSTEIRDVLSLYLGIIEASNVNNVITATILEHSRNSMKLYLKHLKDILIRLRSLNKKNYQFTDVNHYLNTISKIFIENLGYSIDLSPFKKMN